MLYMSHSTQSKMKHFGSLCILLILVHFSTQIAKYENCPENIMTIEQCDCCEVKCSSGGSELMMKTCAPSRCRPGTQIGYHEQDNTKVYPDCCGHPICS